MIENACPFSVKQESRMDEIARYFTNEGENGS